MVEEISRVERDQAGRVRWIVRACRLARPLHGGARRLARRNAVTSAAEQVRARDGDQPFRPRARRRALGQSAGRAGGRRPSSPCYVTGCARPRTPIGRSRSTSSTRSRARGCSMRKARRTMPSRLMSAAADAEDKTEKAPVTPGPLAPARELYGAMLLERGAGRRCASRLRGDAQEGAAPLQCDGRRRHGRHQARRQGEGEGLLR